VLFIFGPPKFVDFRNEPPGELGVGREFHRLYLSHEVTMVIAVPVVVSQHSAVIDGAALEIDVSHAVSHDLTIFYEGVIRYHRSFTDPFEAVLLQTCLPTPESYHR
jgi:hypothetical protein